MPRYRLDISYDGTSYVGWQVQPKGMTVQGKIETVISELTGETVKIHGSGRTDQGVHAHRQVAHTDLATPQVASRLKKGMNALLPSDIRILRVLRVKEAFHARKSARGKEYRYFIWNSDIVPPPIRLYRAHIRPKLDIAAMKEAAGLLVGRHDFSAFTANSNSEIDSTIRDLFELKVSRRSSEIVIVAKGSGFLYKMVRSLAGFLIKVGEGAEPPSETLEILDSRERTARVPTARPEGLFLWNVTY